MNLSWNLWKLFTKKKINVGSIGLLEEQSNNPVHNSSRVKCYPKIDGRSAGFDNKHGIVDQRFRSPCNRAT